MRRGVPLVALTTLVLAVAVFASAAVLFLVVDHILRQQVQKNVHQEATLLLESSATTVAKFLWNFDDEGVQTLGDEVYRNPLIVSVEIRNDADSAVYWAQRGGAVFERLRAPAFYQEHWIGSIILQISEDQIRDRTAALERPAALAVGAVLLLMLAVTPVVMATTVLGPIRRLGRRLELDPQEWTEESLRTKSRVREVSAVEGALRTLVAAVNENVRTLEERVDERTEALRATQLRLAHAEAQAAAGRLAAGVSHELNTPLAAILSSARTLRVDLMDGLVQRLAGPGDPEYYALLARASTLSPLLDARADRRARAALKPAWVESGRDPETSLFDLLSTEALRPVALEVLLWAPGSWRETGLYQTLLLSRFLGIIEESAEKAGRVVRSLSGHLEHPDDPPRWFSVARTLDRSLDLHRSRSSYDLEIRRVYEPGLLVFGPEGRLGQAWFSLITNAFQAVGSRGWIEVGAQVEGDEAVVWVADSGPPIPNDAHEHLFEPYFTTRSGGLGLGLPLAQTILASLGGDVTYQTEGKKAFVTRWPLPRSELEDEGQEDEGGER